MQMGKRTVWDDLKAERPLSEEGRAAYEDEARISDFRGLVHRLRTEAGLTQAEVAQRMGTTQSAIARMEGGGSRPSLDTLERLAAAVGAELVVGFGENLSGNPGIAKLVREGHAVIRRAS
jgi:transcriptional regulator with XRE-family HTH domain